MWNSATSLRIESFSKQCNAFPIIYLKKRKKNKSKYLHKRFTISLGIDVYWVYRIIFTISGLFSSTKILNFNFIFFNVIRGRCRRLPMYLSTGLIWNKMRDSATSLRIESISKQCNAFPIIYLKKKKKNLNIYTIDSRFFRYRRVLCLSNNNYHKRFIFTYQKHIEF